MAIITEQPEPPSPQPQPQPLRRSSSTPPHLHHSTTSPPPSAAAPKNPFFFWFYFTLSVTLTTLLSFSLLSPPQTPQSHFLSLPTSLLHHYSTGLTLKVQTAPHLPLTQLFTFQNHNTHSHQNPQKALLIVPGLGCSSYSFRKLVEAFVEKGIRAIAIDLPGSGFSDKTVVVEEEVSGGVFGPFWEIYYEIKEKGLFWGFDQLVEKGYVNQEEIRTNKGFKREIARPIELGPEELGRVLGQVIDSLGLAPVDLVLHDSALGLSANWVVENSGLVRSLTLVDTTSSDSALPLWVLEVPVVREVVLGFGFVFKRVVESYCSRSVGGSDMEAHRVLLKGGGARRAIVGMGKKMNRSLDLLEWGSSERVRDLPMQVIWSKDWSKEWSEEGNKVADALPKASFVTHSGGRWPQDDVADQLAESISQFLSKLPKPVRKTENEPIPEHIQKMFNEAKESDHHHDHHHSHDHGHGHSAGYMDAYGLGNAWAS